MLPTVHFPSNTFLHFLPFFAQPNVQDEKGPTANLQSSTARYTLVCWSCHGSGGYWLAFRREGPCVRFMVDRQSREYLYLRVLQFSPVSIIPPLLHTHPFIYHPRCIIFFSQYFIFPLSVSFHHCSILIHSSTTHTVQCFSPSTSVFLCQYHSTIAPYSFIHLPPTLYNVFLPALQFSPVSIILPLLHIHSFIYHPHCIMFFSQYFSFPQSVSFHHCSILIHSSTTHAV